MPDTLSHTKQLDRLLRMIITCLVDHPSRIKVEHFDTGSSIDFDIRVDPRDLGKVIGQKGQTVKAIRMLARACGQKELRVFNLEIRPDG